MAETVYLATATFPFLTGDSDDLSVMTFHFRGLDSQSEALDAAVINGALQQFFTEEDGQGASLGKFMSSALDPDAAFIKVYNLADPRPRVPLIHAPIEDLVVDPGQGMASEVSVVVEYRHRATSGENQARMRGWFNFGPLANEDDAGVIRTLAMGANNSPIVAPELRAKLIERADNMQTQLNVLGTVAWCTFSPTTAGPLAPVPNPPVSTPSWTLAELAASYRIVSQVRVDANFDTQTRRGEKFAKGPWTTL